MPVGHAVTASSFNRCRSPPSVGGIPAGLVTWISLRRCAGDLSVPCVGSRSVGPRSVPIPGILQQTSRRINAPEIPGAPALRPLVRTPPDPASPLVLSGGGLGPAAPIGVDS
ncbi:hypothetical protein GCM10010515_47660 [Streptomyces fructofermentans]|uniref:Uncharacterized protein n=1 Tax=Streptomyces fructofermentans TaxID=152141 RepID=A0A918NK84_9ACTN|nr:hypothetical protein GCM10010515_47660 [Streptomyces fructofermentans]